MKRLPVRRGVIYAGLVLALAGIAVPCWLTCEYAMDAWVLAREIYGLCALGLLLAALLIGPLLSLFPRLPINPHLALGRRAIGVSAFVMACAHVICFLAPTIAEDWHDIFRSNGVSVEWLRYFDSDNLWIAGLIPGLLGFLLLAALAVTSRDRMVLKLGPKRWKRLHYTIYLALPLLLVHALLCGGDFGVTEPLNFTGMPDAGAGIGFAALTSVWAALFLAREIKTGWPRMKKLLALVPRFSLATLMAFVLFSVSAFTLWLHWDPWEARVLEAGLPGRPHSYIGSPPPVAATILPDGSRAVTATNDKEAILWDCNTGVKLAVLSGPRDTIVDARFSPDGSRVVLFSTEDSLWSCSAGSPTRFIKLMEKSDSEPPDGLFNGLLRCRAMVAWLYDTANGRQLAMIGPLGERSDLRFASYGQLILTLNGNQFDIWDAAAGQHRATVERKGFVVGSGQSLRVLLEEEKPALSGFGIKIGKPSEEFVEKAINDSANVCPSPSGRTIFTISRDYQIYVWDSQTFEKRLLSALPADQSWNYTKLSIVTDSCLAIEKNWNAIVLCNVTTGRVTDEITSTSYHRLSSCRYAIRGGDGIHVIDVARGTNTLLIPKRSIESAPEFEWSWAIDASADEKRVITVDAFKTVVLWRWRRPDAWWGAACLPEFWLTAVFALALAWSVRCDRRQLKRRMPKTNDKGQMTKDN